MEKGPTSISARDNDDLSCQVGNVLDFESRPWWVRVANERELSTHNEGNEIERREGISLVPA